MMLNEKIGIMFQEYNKKIIASISLDELEKTPENINQLLREATEIYLRHIKEMKEIISISKKLRLQKKEVPAYLMWNFGDKIFKLIKNLEENNFEFQSLYECLNRDLGVSNKTLERVVSFRRYLFDSKRIPPELNWGDLKGAPKKNLNKFIKKDI